MFDVVALGSATKDIFLFPKESNLKPGINKHFLEIPFDKKLEVEKTLEFTGGSATNAVATFAKFGKSVASISKIGHDSNGDFIITDLKSRGVFTDYIVRGKGETPFSTIVVAKNNNMILFIYRGIEKTITMDDIKLDFKSKWLYVGPLAGESYKVLPEIVKYCKENDIKIVLNPGSNELNLKIKKMEPVLKNIDIISMNDEEAKQFVGYGNDIKNLVKLGKAVKTTAIITKGEKGSLVFSDDEIYEAEAFPTKQINFVGAGDAFLSGFINALIDKKDIIDAISLGSYNASNVIKHYGAKEGIVEEYPKQKLKIRRTKYEKK
jgi:sugar/nucleoside kinase (ribokinase family)